MADWLRSLAIFNRVPLGSGRLQLRQCRGCAGQRMGEGWSERMQGGRFGDRMVKSAHPGSRFLLWVDAVGGFLVCLDDEVILGQAIPSSEAHIPIFGDLSRRHMTIRREGEGYVAGPRGGVCVEGRPIQSPMMLSDGDEIQMGQTVRLRFRQPHPLSMTARLDFLSHHRTHPSADAVLLMADTCILGPGLANHVVCRDWSGDVVLFRSGPDQLQCRAEGLVEIDAKRAAGHGPITKSSRITGTDFALCLEEL